MNRAQKRKLAKRVNTPQKLEEVTDRLVKIRTEYLKNEYNKRIVDYTEVMIVMTAYTLNLEGYGKKRLPKIMKRIMMNIDSFRTGELQTEDYDVIKAEVEKLGISLGDAKNGE